MIINIINIILKNLCIILINNIGYFYKSRVISRIVISVFIAQFVNTAFIVLLAHANFHNAPFEWDTNKWFKQSYSDFTSDWYISIGETLIQTMLISAVMPYVTFFGTYLIL